MQWPTMSLRAMCVCGTCHFCVTISTFLHMAQVYIIRIVFLCLKVTDFVQRKDVREAIGVGDHSWSQCNTLVHALVSICDVPHLQESHMLIHETL